MQSLAGLPEVPCVKCEKRVPGLAWGDYCPNCRAEREGRASLLARRISQLAAIAMVVYVFVALPNTVGARAWGAIIVAATYLLVRQIVTTLAMEFLPK